MDIIKEAKWILERINYTQGIFTLNDLYKMGNNGLTISEFSAIIGSLKINDYISEIKDLSPINIMPPSYQITGKGLQVINGTLTIDFSSLSTKSVTMDYSVKDSFNTNVGRDQIIESYNNPTPKRKINWLKTISLIITIIAGILAIEKAVEPYLKVQQSQAKSTTHPPTQKSQVH